MEHSTESPQATLRARCLGAVGRFAIARRRWIFAILGLVALACAALLPSMHISTSRHGLVSPHDPYQARLIKFFEDFGYPDAMLVVISGDDAALRRAYVDAFVQRLKKVPEFSERVMARMDPSQVAELLLLTNPTLSTDIEALLPSQEHFMAEFLAQGLGGMLQTMAGHLSQSGSQRTPAEQTTLLVHAAAIAKALDAYLSGADPLQHLLEANQQAFANSPWHLDESGYLQGRQGTHHIVAILADLPSDDVQDVKPTVQTIRRIRDELVAQRPQFATLRAELTGMPALAVDEQHFIQVGLQQSSVAAGLGIFLLFFLVFRSLQQTLVSLLPLGIGTLATLGVVRLTYGELNLVTSSFVSVLMGLGIDFAVHFVARFNELRRQGFDPHISVIQALMRAGPGILTGAITTAMAFLTTTTTEFTAFAELGIITSVGLALMLVATFLLLPASLSLPSLTRTPPPRLSQMMRFDTLSELIQYARWPLLFLGVLAGIAGAMQFDNLQFNSRYFDFLPGGTESAQALAKIEADGSMSPVFANVTAGSVDEARRMAKELRALDAVGSVETATDLLPPLSEQHLASLQRLTAHSARDPKFSALANAPASAQELHAALMPLVHYAARLQLSLSFVGYGTEQLRDAVSAMQQLQHTVENLPNDGQELIANLQADLASVLERAFATATQVAKRGVYTPDDLPPLLQVRFVSTDKQRLALFVYPAGNIWQPEQAARFAQSVEMVDSTASGIALNIHKHPRMIVEGFQRAALLAAFLVFLILLWDFRRPVDALLALTPVTFGWLWMLGLMRVFGVDFDVANIVALPLVLGIGIDTGVHMVHRVIDSAKEHGGKARLHEVMQGTGAAVTLAAVTTMVGFAALLVADYGAMHSLGKVMVLGICSSLVACLFVLPALLLLLGRAR